jgi:hypothetical protein
VVEASGQKITSAFFIAFGSHSCRAICRKRFRSILAWTQTWPFLGKGFSAIGFTKRSYRMKSFTKWFSGPVALVLLASTVAASDTIIAGKIKSINAEKKEFVLTDGASKDHTFELGAAVVISHDGKESPSDLKANDTVSICYDKGTLTWTAHYILVQEGNAKNFQLRHGSFKNYDSGKKTFTYTDAEGKDWTYAMNGANVRLNMQPSKIEDLKIGDATLAVVDEVGAKTTLKDLMGSRK